jgi:hypothetical protein
MTQAGLDFVHVRSLDPPHAPRQDQVDDPPHEPAILENEVPVVHAN